MFFCRLLLVGLLGTLFGCKRETSNSASDAGAASSAAASASAAAMPVPFSTGPALVQAGPKLPKEFEGVLLYCDTESREMFNRCDAYSAWRASRWFTETNSQSELVPLLSDPRIIVRLLAANAIGHHDCKSGCAYAVDRALSERILGHAETEKDERVLSNYPDIITKIDVNATGLRERVESVIQARPKELALGTLRYWLQRNPSMFSRLAEFARSPNRDIRMGALSGLSRTLGGEHHAEVCNILIDALPTLELDTVSPSIIEGEGGSRCVDGWDKYLTNAAKRIQSPDPSDRTFLRQLLGLYERPEATPSQKARVVALARSVAESTKKEASMRITALKFVARHDKRPLPYLQRFRNDPETKVANAAQKFEKEIMESTALARPVETRPAPALSR